MLNTFGRQHQPSVTILPFHAKAHCSLDRIAVAEVVETGVDKALAIDRILVIIPVIGTANPKTAPNAVIAACKAHSLNIDLRSFKELIVKIGDTVDVGPVKQALVILP